jgi:hypothetical protein
MYYTNAKLSLFKTPDLALAIKILCQSGGWHTTDIRTLVNALILMGKSRNDRPDLLLAYSMVNLKHYNQCNLSVAYRISINKD